MISCPCCATKIEGVALPADQIYKLRDGEVVLYKRPESSRWQARFKLPDGKWHNISTKRASLDESKRIAAEAYDKARFRFADGQSPVSRRFRDVARLTITDMDKATESGRGKVIYKDYKQVLEKYFIPYFGSQHIDRLTDADMMKFEAWRLQQMGKPTAIGAVIAIFIWIVVKNYVIHPKKSVNKIPEPQGVVLPHETAIPNQADMQKELDVMTRNMEIDSTRRKAEGAEQQYQTPHPTSQKKQWQLYSGPSNPAPSAGGNSAPKRD